MPSAEVINANIKKLTWARSLRWLGWGLSETLIPILIISYSKSYTEAGVFKSIYDLVFLISLPFVSILADYIPAKFLLLFALIIYPFIGFSYFLVGALAVAFPIIIARSLNGIAWCCDNVGANTYLRKFASTVHLSKSFGYLEAIPNFVWLLAALASIPLIKFIPVHYFFLAIIPTSLLAFLIVGRLPKDQVQNVCASTEKRNWLASIKALKDYDRGIWMLAWLSFLVGCIDIMGVFFLPLLVYSQGQNITKVIVISAIFSIPNALAFWLGKSIDGHSKKLWIVSSFILVAMLLFTLCFFNKYIYQVIGILILGVLLVSLDLCIQNLTTITAGQSRYGRVGGLILGASTLGTIVAPVALGLIIDKGGMIAVFVILGIISIITAFGVLVYKFDNITEKTQCS